MTEPTLRDEIEVVELVAAVSERLGNGPSTESRALRAVCSAAKIADGAIVRILLMRDGRCVLQPNWGLGPAPPEIREILEKFFSITPNTPTVEER